MELTLLEALGALVPEYPLFAGSIVSLFRARTTWCILQVVGAGGLVVVVLNHVCEALHVPWMGWGLGNSFGHYVDLSSAVLAVALFPLWYLADALGRRDART